jgi:transcriptional regulator with XRE-family HTH domain
VPHVASLEFSGAKLRAARKQAGLSVAELADLACRGVDSVYHYEQGAQRPSVNAVKAMARILGLDYADLLSIEDVKPDA